MSTGGAGARDILAVDDDPGQIELMRRILRRAGFTNRFLAFADGQEALDYIFATGACREPAVGPGPLVVLDINMPGTLDGYEVLRRVRADCRTALLPVIVLSTTDDPREADRCLQLGCDVYLTKSLDPGPLVEAVHRLGSPWAARAAGG